jgi:phosphoserine aminotransferase
MPTTTTPSSTVTQRIHNFSAGPAVLPLAVLEEAQRDLLMLPGVGMSVLEISHRSAAFDEIIEGAERDLRALGGIPDNYQVLFLQGGASLQFSMVPMNLMPAGGSADYIVSGVWSEKAVKEAKRVGTVNIAATTAAENFARVPRQDEFKLSPNAAYVHYTSNNTIYGTQFHTVPDVGPGAGTVPLVNDASSDIFSRPIDVEKFGLIYAGAQKNLGPSGVTVVIIRDDLVKRSPANLATMLSYAVQAENKSLYNTPPVFGIYILRLVLKWLIANGGLQAMATVNERKAGKLYAEIDRTGFYRGHAEKDSRSRMNVTFRLPSEDLEKAFVKESTLAGLDGLKGHRSVGGLRASIYNAFPEAGIEALVQFMREFERVRG